MEEEKKESSVEEKLEKEKLEAVLKKCSKIIKSAGFNSIIAVVSDKKITAVAINSSGNEVIGIIVSILRRYPELISYVAREMNKIRNKITLQRAIPDVLRQKRS